MGGLSDYPVSVLIVVMDGMGRDFPKRLFVG